MELIAEVFFAEANSSLRVCASRDEYPAVAFPPAQKLRAPVAPRAIPRRDPRATSTHARFPPKWFHAMRPRELIFANQFPAAHINTNTTNHRPSLGCDRISGKMARSSTR